MFYKSFSTTILAILVLGQAVVPGALASDIVCPYDEPNCCKLSTFPPQVTGLQPAGFKMVIPAFVGEEIRAGAINSAWQNFTCLPVERSPVNLERAHTLQKFK
ncbi:hypothetical protein C8R44DRAFT_749944 [Mycena epipterygia]|nr:hypothetical protein C8R44DRAFT_749944 [Mycena epipterygia]